MSTGFYEGWRPGRGEVADLVAVELGLIDWDEQLHRSRQRKTGHPDLAEFTGQDFADHRRRQALATTQPRTTGRTSITPATRSSRTRQNRMPPNSRSSAATSRGAVVPAVIPDRELFPDLTAALARAVQDAETFIGLAELAAREMVRLIQDAHWAGITARFAGEPFTAAHTHPVVLAVDAAQYAQGDGPCLTAMRTNQQVATTLAAGRTRWPQLAGVAAASGVRSFLAEPLHAQGRVVGSLNLYSARSRGLRNSDPDLLTELTASLDRGLDDYWNTRSDADRATQLQETLRQRWVTNQAIGMLMAAHGFTTQDATAALQQQATKNGVTTHQAAQQLIDQQPRRSPLPPRTTPT